MENKKHILVVDDDKLVTVTLKKLLKKSGYDVATVASGRQAVALIKENDFALIISDMRMPDMDGIETLKAIDAIQYAHDRPIIPKIIITGYADEEKQKQAFEMDVVEYIYKPFDVADILKAVEKAFNDNCY